MVKAKISTPNARLSGETQESGMSFELNQARTAEYRSRLRALYLDKLVLVDSRGYTGTRMGLDYHCHICGSDFQARAATVMRGSGCQRCHTKSESILQLDAYQRELRGLHNGTITIELARTSRFKSSKLYVHKCSVCCSSYHTTPDTVRDPNFICKYCAPIRALSTTRYDYTQRLRAKYHSGYSIAIFGSRLHLRAPTRHRCSICRLVWWDSMASMLTGTSTTGCPHTQVSPSKTFEYEFNNNSYVLRNQAESKALYQVLNKIPHEFLKTALTFPIPIIPSSRGNRVPAFMDKSTGMLVDVLTAKQFDSDLSKWCSISLAARDADLDYRILVVDGARVRILARDWYMR